MGINCSRILLRRLREPRGETVEYHKGRMSEIMNDVI